jgi:hypothetical protein
MEETLSHLNKADRKRSLAELEKYGIVFKPAANAIEDAALERMLQELRRRGDITETKLADIDNMRNDILDHYFMMMADYFIKLALASLFLYWSYPLVASWWPPFSYYDHNTQK